MSSNGAKPTSLRDRIMAAPDLKSESVEVPEWGFPVFVRELSAAEAGGFQRAMLKVVDMGGGRFNAIYDPPADFKIRMVAAALVDETGTRLFNDREIEVLGKKSETAINRLFEVAMRLSKMGEKAADAAEKSSAPTPGDASSSDSRSPSA